MSPVKIIEPKNGRPKRPELLTLLCILSFIGSGLAGFSNLIVAITYYGIDDIIASSGINIPGLQEMLSAGRTFFVLSFTMYLISFIGIFNMWRLKKIGFHIYTISQIIILILPSFFIAGLGFPTIPFLVTAMFVFLYAANMRYMS